MSPSRGVHEDYALRILAEVEAGRGVSQRVLAKRIGIALGLTNLLLRRLIRKGWIKMSRISANRVRYLLTPEGIAEKTSMTRAYLAASTRFYAEARDRVRERLAVLSAECPTTGCSKRIAFLGGSEVAEIGYVCLQETDMRLVAVFDDVRRSAFFGVDVHPESTLAAAKRPQFDRLVVMSFDQVDTIRARLDALGVSGDVVFWI